MLRREILFAHFPRLTFKRQQEILKLAGSFEAAWNLKQNDLKKIGWKDDLAQAFVEWKSNIDEKKVEQILNQEKIHCLTKSDSHYPTLLKEIFDPPLCLFVRGDLSKINLPIAVVGPRKFSLYGKQITEDLTSQLVKNNISIISGLATGIDSIAHQTALNYGGHTVAVLGGGVNKNHVQPSAQKKLAENIINSGGALVSEYPPGTVPNKFTFPKRNRIIAGISIGTLVIEAGEGSGSLITAQCALDSGREVLTIPQNITSQTSAGSNNLLKTGATLVTSITDITELLNLQKIPHYVKNKEIITNLPSERALLEHLSAQPAHIDELAKKSNISSSDTSSTLTIMEMKGYIKNVGGMMYILNQ